MTRDDEQLFECFEQRLQQLLDRCDTLRAENSRLRAELEAANAELRQSYQEHAALEETHRMLRAGRTLQGLEVGDVDQTRERLSRLVREVDRCIALLNADAKQL